MKYVLMILLLIGSGYAQSFEYAWANQISGGISDSGNGIAMDSDGNVFVSGTFSGNLTIGTKTLESTGSSDSFLIKYDNNGNLLWAQSSENNGSNGAYGVSTDQFGNCILTGRFYDSVTFGDWTLTSSGEGDIYTIKFDSNGTVIWAKKSGGIGSDAGRAISVNNLGEIFITGYFEGTAYFDSEVLIDSNSKVFITKYDVDGNVIWAKETNVRYGRGLGPHIASDDFGNCFITTHMESSRGTNIYVAKYDSNGDMVWSRIIDSQPQYTGNYTYDYGRGIAVDSIGNVFVAGTFDDILNFASDTLNCSGGRGWENIFFAKYDTNGNEVWARQLCDAHYEGPQTKSIITDNNDNVIVTGYFEDSIEVEGKTLTSNGSSSDTFLCKYDNDGNLLWAISNGGGSSDRGSGAAANECGNIIAIGSFRSTITFDSMSLYCPSGYDLFVTKVTKTYIGDFDKDCQVDMMDFVDLAIAWLSEVDGPRWNQECNISEPTDSIIDLNDFLFFSEHWLQGVE